MTFAEVKARRTHQVTDVFDKQDPVVIQRQARRGVGDHLRVEMAAFAGVDLNRRGAGGADARGVVHRLLIAFNHRAGGFLFQPQQGFRQQGGFAGAGAGDQIQHQLVFRGEARAVAGGQTVVFIQHVDFHFQHPPLALARRMGTRLAVTVVQVASLRAGGGKVIGFHAGNVHHLARGGREGGAAKRRMRVMLVAFYIKVAFTAAAGCTHNLITPLLVAESVSRHPPRFAAGRSDTAGSGARAGR